MNKRLTISAKDENIPFPAAVSGSKTPVLKLSIKINNVIRNLLQPAAKLNAIQRTPAAGRMSDIFILLCGWSCRS